MTADPLLAPVPPRRLGRPIRPPDPAISGTTLAYMPIGSAEACRRLVHLAFRDASSVLDLTYAAGNFWRDPLPPGLTIATNNLDPAADTDFHLDFTATGLAEASYDLVIYDPPHVADGGASGIMAKRYGTVKSTRALRELIVAGAAEAWRCSAVGMIVKVADHHHGGRYLPETDWVKAAIAMPVYTQLSTLRSTYLRFGRHRVERVPRSNGATYLVFRRSGGSHVDFDALWRRQEMSHLRGPGSAKDEPRLCRMCDTVIPVSRYANAVTCSDRCRKRAERARTRRRNELWGG